MENKFSGFDEPRQNWVKLPHALIENMHLIKSGSELKVILYVLRHTWGYGDAEKRISIDEFCNGRKKKGGERIDKGTGLSSNSIKKGIAAAIEHGFIEMTEDASDKARIKRFYQLKGSKSGGQKLTPRGSEVDPLASEVDPRTKKDTFERNNREKLTTSGGGPKSTRSPVFTTYEKEIGALSPIIAQMVGQAIDTYPEAWIIEAIEIAAKANARRWNYVEGILKRWQSDGRGAAKPKAADHKPEKQYRSMAEEQI